MFRSSDNGASWIQVPNGLTHPVIRALAVSPIGSIFAGTGTNGIHRSADNGSNWSQVGLAGLSIQSITVNSQGHIFAGTSSNGVFRSTDNGQTWTDLSSGLTILRAAALAITPDGFIYAGTFGGAVLKSRQSTTSVQWTESNIPSSFALWQNFPNPFNPTTRIRFNVPRATFTRLSIFEPLGREVATLLEAELNLGTYDVDWNARGFATGVYYYRLQAGSFVETKKLILLR